MIYFIIAFAFGIFWVYIVTPPQEVVVKFPSPYNAGGITYKDKSDSCYKYEAQEVECSKFKWKPQPIIEDFRAKSAHAKKSPTFSKDKVE